MNTRWLTCGLALLILITNALAADATPPATPTTTPTTTRPASTQPRIKPTLADVAYGTHPKQVLDFYKASAAGPTPVVLFIHGGGWTHGSKAGIGSVAECLRAGISIVSVEYRFIDDAEKEGVQPPVYAPLHDAARALQFVRSKAGEWNIDKTRIGASGGSAGACSSLWLAFHDDMAEPASTDPVARESTRLTCAAVIVPQTSLDPQQMKEWTPNSRYGAHAFGFKGDKVKKISAFQQFLDGREQILPWIKEYSPYELVTADDPPIYMVYPTPPALGQDQKDPTHTANFGVKLQEKCRSACVACELMYPGAPEARHASVSAYLIDMLKTPK